MLARFGLRCGRKVKKATMSEPSIALELIHRDYEATRGFLESANASVDRTRTFGLALIAALFGVAITSQSWPIGAVATIAVLVVAIVDAFYSWQYSIALRHARRVERIYEAMYGRLTNARPRGRYEHDLEVRLRAFRPGVFAELRQFRIRELRFSEPKPIFRFLYPVLVIAGIAVSVLASNEPASSILIGRPVTVINTSPTKPRVHRGTRPPSPRTTLIPFPPAGP